MGEDTPMHLFRVIFTRPPKEREVTGRTKVFFAIGSDEANAISHVYAMYAGSSFEKEYLVHGARAEFQPGGIVRIAG